MQNKQRIRSNLIGRGTVCSCLRVVDDKMMLYRAYVSAGYSETEALDRAYLEEPCCRAYALTTVSLTLELQRQMAETSYWKATEVGNLAAST